MESAPPASSTRRSRLPILMSAVFAAFALATAHIGLTVHAQGSATPSASIPSIVITDALLELVPSLPEAEAAYGIGNNGLYRSLDGGQTWEQTGLRPPAASLAAAMRDPDVLLAGDRLECGGAEEDQPSPLFRSEDGGRDWKTVVEASIQPIAIWDEGQTALGADRLGLLRSQDGGFTWEGLPVPDSNYVVTAAAPIGSAQGTAAQTALVVGTSEGGMSRVWHADLTVPADSVYRELGVEPFWNCASVAGRDDVYVIGTAQGVLISTDGGRTFPPEPSRTGLEEATISVDPGRESIPQAERDRGYGINAVAIDPGVAGHLYAGTSAGLFESTDQGVTWQRVPGIEGNVSEVVLSPGGERLLAETDDGVAALQ
jgi:photosystem II stability/assembly factor-like uncharacterized protein